jgi:opacity protein-like surface antigen
MGYRINQYIGIELAYVNLGVQGFSATGDALDVPWELIDPSITEDDLVGLDATADLDGEIRSGGALLNVLGTYPINNFEISGRLGLFFAKTKLSGRIFLQDNTDPTLTAEQTFEQTKSTMEFAAGIGAGYTFFDHLQVRLDYSFYADVGDENTTLETDVSTITAGVAYRF